MRTTRGLFLHSALCIAVLALGSLLWVAAAGGAKHVRAPRVGSNWEPPQGGRSLGTGLSTTDMNSITAMQLAETLVGLDPTITNAVVTGANTALGQFSGGAGILAFDDGILLSTGSIASVIGGVPDSNSNDDTGIDQSEDGDADLDSLTGGFPTEDAAILDFDFECAGNQVIQFQFQFASEEYNEFVDDVFNDVFGFFLNGVNIGLLPGSNQPVAINNINCGFPYDPATGSLCALFINNDCDDLPGGSFPCNGPVDTEMDGMTVQLTAGGPVNPGVNHLKLAIADTSDGIYDSAVFIKTESLTCFEATGACRNCTSNPVQCVDDVTVSECQGAGDTWFAGLSCEQVDVCPVCGNGVIEFGESCDGTNLAGQTCITQGFDGGLLACNASCTGFDTSNCTGPLCGNGAVDPGESCDGANLDGQTCITQGFDGGALACNPSCTTFDTSGCTDCGDGVCDPGEVCLADGSGPDLCDDSVDNDCDGIVDNDQDEDGLGDECDPCPTERLNECFGPVAIDNPTGFDLRINTHSTSTVACSGEQVDCRGRTWVADFGAPVYGTGYNQAADDEVCMLDPCAVDASPVFGCTSPETENLAKCGHFDPAGDPELSYTFDVANGDYIVNLLFMNTFIGTDGPGERIFSVAINDETPSQLFEFDQVVAAGGACDLENETCVPVSRSAKATASGGTGLRIDFLTGPVQRPNIKGIEILCNDDDAGPWYEDSDDDGFGNAAVSRRACSQPPGFVSDASDNCPADSNPLQEDGDDDGLGDECDPCPTQRLNECFGPVAIDNVTGFDLRINTHSTSTDYCSGEQVDCRGRTWVADFGAPVYGTGYNQAADDEVCMLDPCAVDASPVFGCTSPETENLAKCGHFDPAGDPELSYTFDVANGDYIVNLLFMNTFIGTDGPGERIFSVAINDETPSQLFEFDQVVAAGGACDLENETCVPVSRSAKATASGGTGLRIDFLTGPVQRPNIKGIEILTECGNDVVDPGEECDGGDCCAADCTFEAPDSGCDDGLFCTDGDTCDGAGSCLAGANRDCSDADICTDDSCDEAADVCVNDFDVTNDPSCEPSDCGNGTLEGLEECDDGNTVDGDCCAADCTFEAPDSGCDDGLFCTDGDTCDGAGTCLAGANRDCSDADICTDDSCDEAADVCVNDFDVTNDPSCATCGNGTLEGLEECDDGNTADGDCCAADCTFEAPDSGCDDGLFCTDGDTCDGAGTCLAGADRDCSDGDICTDDSCDEAADACLNEFDLSNDASCAICGDSILSGDEECDDGNLIGGDGCEADCQATVAGRIPHNGSNALTLDKLAGGAIRLDWDNSCLATDDDYEIYEGMLGDVASSMLRACTTEAALTYTLNPSAGNRFYLVVPRNALREGSYGQSRGGVERPASTTPCLPQKIGDCG